MLYLAPTECFTDGIGDQYATLKDLVLKKSLFLAPSENLAVFAMPGHVVDGLLSSTALPRPTSHLASPALCCRPWWASESVEPSWVVSLSYGYCCHCCTSFHQSSLHTYALDASHCDRWVVYPFGRWEN